MNGREAPTGRPGQASFVEAFASTKLGRNARLDQIGTQVRWYRFEKILSALKPEAAGRPPYEPLLMFKALLLQQWYVLSDAELEEALNDRVSFRRFLALALDADAPDHTTLCRFRNRLVAAGADDAAVRGIRSPDGASRPRAQARHDAGCDAGRGGGGASGAGPRGAGERSGCGFCAAFRQTGLDLWVQGASGRRPRNAADPRGADHAGQCQRDQRGGRADPRRRAGGLRRQGLSDASPARAAAARRRQGPHHAQRLGRRPAADALAEAAQRPHRPQARCGRDRVRGVQAPHGLLPRALLRPRQERRPAPDAGARLQYAARRRARHPPGPWRQTDARGASKIGRHSPKQRSSASKPQPADQNYRQKPAPGGSSRITQQFPQGRVRRISVGGGDQRIG